MSEDRPVALVTGSASGIGASVATALARTGHDIAINFSRNAKGAENVAAECNRAGAVSITVQCDVSEETQVVKMLRQVQETFGRLDTLVNNAGTTISTAPEKFDEIRVEEWDRVYGVNVRGVFLTTKHSAALLRESSRACIVNMASIVGLRPGPQPLPYSSSKAAVINMTRTLAGALGPNIRVNAVAPGWMEGEWMEGALGDDYERLMERRARFTPLRRCATSEDVAETVVNLVESNRFVTGQVIVIDGGYSSVT